MTSRRLYCATAIAALCIASIANSYELATHGLITNQAYKFSTLNSTATFAKLGVVDVPAPFADSYYDFSAQPNTVYRRPATTYEGRIMAVSSVGVARPLSVLGWMANGAIREDDGGLLAGIRLGEPLDDPFGNINRFCNHFLDPITRNGLSLSLLQDPLNLCPNGSTPNSANWAQGTVQGSGDAFSATPIDANSRNHFSVFAAREAMWRALTLRKKDGTPAPRPDALFSNPSWTKEDDRKAYWATTFRAVGDILHLNQDLAQPQHTRNEAHGTDHATLYERYVDARARQSRKFAFDGEGNIQAELGELPPLPVNVTYPIPRFNRYSDYWSTEQGSASILSGNGLADYSSRGFFTPAKNLGTTFTGFPSPTNNENLYSTVADPTQPSGGCRIYPGKPQYARGKLPDDFVVPGDPMAKTRYASRSLVSGQWTMDRCVFDDRIDLLIPRAVAYSAGLIDYFFRGQLEVTPPEEGVYSLIDHYDFSGDGKNATDAIGGLKGFKTIKLKLRNATPDITPSGTSTAIPQTMTTAVGATLAGGTLVAVLKFYRNKNYTDDLGGEPATDTATATAAYLAGRSANEEIVVSTRVKDGAGVLLAAPIAVANTPQTFVFEFDNELPINATDVQLQVVYRGTLGNEADAVVVQTIDLSEPTYFTYMNATDYIKLGQSVYTPAEINAATPTGATLRSLVRPTTCIDTTTNQLKDIPTCFPPFAINFAAKWGSRLASNASVALPLEQTFHRLAMLVPPGGYASVIQSTSPCLPNDALNVAGRILQTNYVADNNVPPNYVPSSFVTYLPAPVRGVKGGYVVACVNNGDGATPGASSDDRFTKMTPLAGANLKPLPIGAFFFGAP